jgi:hypothetical protein
MTQVTAPYCRAQPRRAACQTISSSQRVRQGLRFLRAELPGILATRTDVLVVAPERRDDVEQVPLPWPRRK